ncbi:gas vesicle protein K [bacterium]|nr:gas vesicle protein K [bacterium]
MPIDINEDNLRQGLLGLVIAIVEIVRDSLKHQALKRMEGGSLNDEEIERLGRALKDIDLAIDQIKEEQGIKESVQSVRDGLDEVVNDIVDKILYPRDEETAKKLESRA